MRQSAKVEAIRKKIEASGRRCALSGWKIDENSFELDHIISIQDGGTDDVDNLQAVHPLVNRAKGTMGNQQFIDLCRAVVKHQDSADASLEDLLDEVRQIGMGINGRVPEQQ